MVESASGVTNALTSTLSKNTYILVNGLTPVAVKLIFLARTTGIATLERVLNPRLSLSICSSTKVLVPVLRRVPTSCSTLFRTLRLRRDFLLL